MDWPTPQTQFIAVGFHLPGCSLGLDSRQRLGPTITSGKTPKTGLPSHARQRWPSTSQKSWFCFAITDITRFYWYHQNTNFSIWQPIRKAALALISHKRKYVSLHHLENIPAHSNVMFVWMFLSYIRQQNSKSWESDHLALTQIFVSSPEFNNHSDFWSLTSNNPCKSRTDYKKKKKKKEQQWVISFTDKKAMLIKKLKDK